ncbi:50S ribosomal protein L10 [Patescibacteria group bacterium]|nr:50S ribosomal protein L10 [Patescibacteria group bacterium]
MPTERKKQIVNNLVERLQPASAVVFSDFTGLSARKMEELRNKLEAQDGHFEVTKNTLINIACQKTIYGELTQEVAIGPTSTLFCSGDPIPPIKTLYEYTQNNGNLKIKGGFLEKRALSREEVISLAQLPTKEILLTQIVYAIQSPLINLAGVMQAGVRDLINVLRQASDKDQITPSTTN